jgi:hypothetical protein
MTRLSYCRSSKGCQSALRTTAKVEISSFTWPMFAERVTTRKTSIIPGRNYREQVKTMSQGDPEPFDYGILRRDLSRLTQM